MRLSRAETHMTTMYSLPLKGRVTNLNANELHSRRAPVTASLTAHTREATSCTRNVVSKRSGTETNLPSSVFSCC